MRNLVLDGERRETVTPTLPTVVTMCQLTPQDVTRALTRIQVDNPVAICAVAMLQATAIRRDCEDGQCGSCERGLSHIFSKLVTTGARNDTYHSFVSRFEERRTVKPTINTASAICTVPDSNWSAAQRRLQTLLRTPEGVVAYAVARIAEGDSTYEHCRRNVFVCISELLNSQ